MVCQLAFIYHCSAPTLRACIKRLYCILLNNPHRTCNIHIHINVKAVPQYTCAWTITILIVWRRKIFHNNFRNPPFSQVGPAPISATRVTGPGTWPRWKQPIFSICPVSAHGATATRSLQARFVVTVTSYTPDFALIHPLILNLASHKDFLETQNLLIIKET